MVNFTWTSLPSQNNISQGLSPLQFIFENEREKKQSERCEKLKQMYEPFPWNIEDENFKLVYA
jgi:hypothetical protein